MTEILKERQQLIDALTALINYHGIGKLYVSKESFYGSGLTFRIDPQTDQAVFELEENNE